MKILAIIDTGPLVALFERGERHHDWAVGRIGELQAPLLVCEPVLVEAMYLLRRDAHAQHGLLSMTTNGALDVAFRLRDHVAPVQALMHKFRDQPMSLADACIVRMAELHERHAILTLDSDFLVYRKYGKTPLELILP